MFFSRRRRAGRDRLYPAKVITLFAGGVLGALGMTIGNSTLVSVAMAVVLVGFLLRFFPSGERDAGETERNADSQ
jgi:hypothetical protein